MPLFLMMFIILFSGSSFYIAKRLHQGFENRLSKKAFWMILGILNLFTIIMITGMAAGHITFAKTISAYWMGIFIYLLLFTILSDLGAIITRLLKGNMRKYRHIAGICIITLTFVTVGYGVWNARDIDVVPYEIVVNKVDVSDVKIVAISDLHLGAVGSEKRLPEIVDEINEQNPDIVCIAGDFFDTNYDAIENPEKAIAELKNISSTYGVFMCLGNHDAGATMEKMLAFAEKAGITLLNEEYTIIDNRLVLVGRLDRAPIGGYKKTKRGEISGVLEGCDKGLPIIVLDHNPARIGEYSNEIDLVISGHTHKGQVFPAGIITDMMYEVDHGYYRKNENSPHVIVTSGIGYWGMPMRVGTDSEIITVKIK